MSWIDITVPLSPKTTPLWPGAPAIHIEKRLSIENGDPVNDSNLSMNLHSGTHVEGALHFIKDGQAIDEISMEAFVGPCQVVEFGNLKVITAADLENAGIDTKTRRLIFKTPNSKKWSPKFDPTFIGLSVDGAEWLVKRKIILIGNDYLSVQPYKGDDNVHRVLLGNGVAVLEGLNLENAKAGFYELLCLPLLIPSVEAAPARALLKPLKEI